MFAGHIKYALQNGWLPVIDMKNYPNAYLRPEQVGKINSWEYYFLQPIGISLDEAYAGDSVIMSSGSEPPTGIPNITLDFYNDVNNQLTEWRMLVKLGLLRVQPSIMEQANYMFNSLFNKEDRVLGLLLRGTDYVKMKPVGHPIPPSNELALQTVSDLMTKWNCNKIFIATEDFNILKFFVERLGDKCSYMNRPYFNDSDYDGKNYINFYHFNRPEDCYLLGMEYLFQMLMLSKCKCFVTARCSGSLGVMMMSNGFEQVYAFDLGNYPPPLLLNLILAIIKCFVFYLEVLLCQLQQQVVVICTVTVVKN